MQPGSVSVRASSDLGWTETRTVETNVDTTGKIYNFFLSNAADASAQGTIKVSWLWIYKVF